MGFLGSLLAPLIPKLLDWVVSAFGQLGSWIWKKYQASSKLNKEKDKIDQQLVRVKAALDEAYNGDEITKEQKQELIDASRELVSGY